MDDAAGCASLNAQQMAGSGADSTPLPVPA